MTYKRAYDIISEFCFTGYKDNKKPTGELFSAIHELVCEVEESTKLKAENKRLSSDNSWLVLTKAEKEFENVDLLEENDKLKAEIEQLKAELEQAVKLPYPTGMPLYIKIKLKKEKVMCRCIYEMQDNLKEKFGYESVSAPVEMLSGRAYLSFTVKEFGKKKEKEIPLMLSKCPFCGEKYNN